MFTSPIRSLLRCCLLFLVVGCAASTTMEEEDSGNPDPLPGSGGGDDAVVLSGGSGGITSSGGGGMLVGVGGSDVAVGGETASGGDGDGGSGTGGSASGGSGGNSGGPPGYTFCANENGTCSFSGAASVAYGAAGSFNYLTVTDSVACNNATFGDALFGIKKACYYKLISGDDGIVYFSNDGLKAGWTSASPQGGTIGRIVEVDDPVYKTATALLTEQTYKEPRGAHSEVVLAQAQGNDEDRYYGQAIYLPEDWNTIDKNTTFQQFSPEDPAGPWTLNWIQQKPGDETYHIYIRVLGTHYDCGPIYKGEWTRVVVRFKTTQDGIFEYWVNGEKKWSVAGIDLTIPNGSPTMRWSVGIYVTWWRDQDPGPQLTRQVYHDQMRITSTYDLADPANWGN